MNDNDRMPAGTAYFARREAQERALSARASDPTARLAHEQLANRYAMLGRVPETA